MAPTMAWFPPEQAQALNDFVAVYDAHFDTISASRMQLAEKHPELRAILAAGCDGYITKPIDIHALPGIVHDHLARPPGTEEG